MKNLNILEFRLSYWFFNLRFAICALVFYFRPAYETIQPRL